MTSVPDYRIVGQRNWTEVNFTGLPVIVDELKICHLFDLLELIDKSSMPVNLSPDQSIEDFSNALVAAVMYTVADDEEELLALLRDILRPKGLHKNPKTDRDAQLNQELWAQLYEELESPDLEDLIDIITAVIERSAETIKALSSLDLNEHESPEDEEEEEVFAPAFTPETVPDFSGRDTLGGFSRVCHLISAEYGWTDEQILDVRLSRFRQIFAAIKEAKWQEHIQKREAASWQVRTLCEFIACTVPANEDESTGALENKLLDAAKLVGLSPRQRREIREASLTPAAFDSDDYYIDEETGERVKLRKSNNFADMAMFQQGLMQGS